MDLREIGVRQSYSDCASLDAECEDGKKSMGHAEEPSPVKLAVTRSHQPADDDYLGGMESLTSTKRSTNSGLCITRTHETNI